MSVGPFFSVVMASHLGPYQGAAKNRPEKFRRAVDSFLDQTFMDAELRIVADGCFDTCDIVARYYSGTARIHLTAIEKQRLWNGSVRNAGIAASKGKWITYLDTDDFFGKEHLEMIWAGLKNPPNGWAYFDDLYWNKDRKLFEIRECDIDRHGKHGTANLVHRRDLNVWWPQDDRRIGYAHDKYFADELKAKGPGVKILTPRYYVSHDVVKAGGGATPIYESRFDV